MALKSPNNDIFLGLVWTIVNMCAIDAGLNFNYSVNDWRRCDSGNKEFLMFRNISIQKCLLECRVRISCKAVMFLTIRRECGLLETDVNMATAYNNRPCVFIRMTDVEDIIPIPNICHNCSTLEACDIRTESCVIRETCGLDWIRMEQSCYYLSLDKKTASEADVYCSSKRAHEVYIETAQENANIKMLLNMTGNTESYFSAWIGITDANTEGLWKYTNTNLNATFTDWEHGQPDNYRVGEHCAMLRGYYSKQWNDVICSAKMAVICEKSLTVKQT